AQEREAFRAGIRLVWLDAELDWVATGSPALERAARLLERVIEDFTPDVLHLSTPALAHLLAAEMPCVAMVHSCVAPWWAAGRGPPLPEPWQWNRSHTEKGLRAASLVVVPSHAFADELCAVYGPLPRLRVIHNGSTLGNVAVAATKEPVVMAAGRWWDEAKNLTAPRRAAPNIGWAVRNPGPPPGPN